MNRISQSFESSYTTETDYIRRLYATVLTADQRKQLQRMEALCKDAQRNLKELTAEDESPTVVFSSLLQQLVQLRKSVENEWKLQRTDYEAFRQKYERLGTPLVPILDIVKLARSTQQPKLELTSNINFPILRFQNRSLAALAAETLKSTAYAREENINEQKIEGLMLRICRTYNVVSYHNFSHAFSLFLMLHQCYSLSEQLRKFVSSFEFFCSLLAAISHDLNHEGTNNLYQVKTNSQLAQKYNNQSVLENMHISTLFRIFREYPELDLISGIKDPQLRERSKRILIGCVLATDMSKHAASLDTFSAKRKATQEFNSAPNKFNEMASLQKTRAQDRQMILEFIVHSCDIGNPCLEFDSYMNWAALLAQQFDDQTKKEAAMGVQVTGFLRYVDRPTFYKGQLGFAKNMVLPLWKELSLLWPSLKVFSEQVEQNLEKLQLRIEAPPK